VLLDQRKFPRSLPAFEYALYVDAIRRETNLKRWKRSWKLALIEKHNPQWNDLLERWNW
jgi:putative endonuclease